MKAIRVLFVISSLQGGGAARVVSELAASLAERSLAVSLLTLEGDQAGDAYPVPARVERSHIQLFWPSHSISAKLTSLLKRLRLLRRAVLDTQPDIVVSFIDTTNIRVLAAMLFSGVPIVVSERTDPRHHAIGRTWQSLRRIFYPLATRVVVQTQQVADWMQHEIPRSRIRVIPNALRPAAFLTTLKEDGAAGRVDNDGRRSLRLISVGRLISSKRFDRLIEGFAEARLAEEGWELVILGDGPERPNLERTISRLQLDASVRLAGHQPDVATWLRRSDLFVMTSEYEGFPNALLEAMQCGLASIATNCESGPSDLISSGTDGLLIPVNDANALVTSMKRLASDPLVRTSMGSAAALACQKFQTDAVNDQWVKLIMSSTPSEKFERPTP